MSARQIVIEFKARMLTQVPEDWDEELIDFWLNAGSSQCLSNFIDQLHDENKRVDDCCFMCHRADALYLRDASAADIEELTPPKPRTDANG